MIHNNIITPSVIGLLFGSLICTNASGYLRRRNTGRKLSVDENTSSSCRSILADLDDAACVSYGNGTMLIGSSYENDDNNPVDSFLGIQYAAVPERFEPSEVYALPHDGSLINATTYGDWCVQVPTITSPADFSISEDCLYLNIWRPTTSVDLQQVDELLPVMVFIHGGSYYSGSGSDPLLDGSNLAGNENVVVVTINYRLGIFGFAPTGNEGTGGMNGLLDQIRALEWVRNYIQLFGGNPELVTVFGESAGALSVAMLSVIPQANGLFKRAIVESGNFGSCNSVEDSMVTVNNVLQQIDCDGNCTIADLKTIDTNELINVTSYFYAPTCDTTVLPDDTFTLYAEGKINPTDMIIGTNTYDDFTIYQKPEDYIKGATNITDSYMWDHFGMDKWDEEQQHGAIDAYSKEKYNGSNVAAFVQFQADRMYVCESRDFAEVAAANIDGLVFSYVFGYLSEYDYALTSGFLELANITIDDTWASHGSELVFVFGNHKHPTPLSPKGKRLSKEIMQRWANFARWGNPSNSDQDEDEEDDYWFTVDPSSSKISAADPKHLLFTGDGGVPIQSDKNKMDQCSAIYISPITASVPAM